MKKRKIAAALLAAACVCASPAFAAAGEADRVYYTSTKTVITSHTLSSEFRFSKVGDVAGTYYSTDIVTYVNGGEISSINIGGQTLISAEDMAYHGFDVNWLGSARRLEITEHPGSGGGAWPVVERPSLPVGTPLGYYYVTDIVTTLNGTPVTAYNIGGRTYIWAEEMRDFGYSVIWNAGARTLSVGSSAGTLPSGGGGSNTSNGLLDQYHAEVVRLVNVERQNAGLAPLGTFDTLTQAAQMRAPELITLFSHSRPDGTDCFTALTSTGADQNIRAAGENIAAGQRTPAEVVTAWMNSPGHRANILSSDFTHIGIGYVQGGEYGHYWVQMFVGK